jgi:hypothetical protein
VSQANLQLEAVHTGAALTGAVHVAPHPPQLCGSMLKITHAPPQTVSPSRHAPRAFRTQTFDGSSQT